MSAREHRVIRNSESLHVEGAVVPDLAALAHGFAASTDRGGAYNEQAFRYFLNSESKRAERSGRPVVFVLVAERTPAHAHSDMAPALARELFAALARGLRETDFIGWYQAHRIAGAVMTQRADASGADLSSAVLERVSRILADHLNPPDAARLQVRVFQIPSKTKGNA